MPSTPSFILLIDPNHLCRTLQADRNVTVVCGWQTPRYLHNVPILWLIFCYLPLAECTCTADRGQREPEWDLDKTKHDTLLPVVATATISVATYASTTGLSSVHRQLSRTTGAMISCWRKATVWKRTISCTLVAEIWITQWVKSQAVKYYKTYKT
jgi:hypothetical protein